MERYQPESIEKKWQDRWEKDQLYQAEIEPEKPKFYFLTMLPYTSGDMHIGHWFAMTPSDARARYLRMKGYNVMYPIGFDAFGLPAENAAILNKAHPKKWTQRTSDMMVDQQKALGLSYDWSRILTSMDPDYYKWNQWFFLQLLKKGLAYKKGAPINWCPKCETVLANEQVEDGKCWRCKADVVEKYLEQWFLKITEYADELLADIDTLENWPEKVKTMQRN